MVFALKAQTDTLTVVTYNVGNYGFPATNDCPLLKPTLKHKYLRTILEYINPDIIGLEKMEGNPSSFSTDTVIDKVLNNAHSEALVANERQHPEYGHAEFTNKSGYKKTNMLYYKTSKLGFISTTTIYGDDPLISDINLHTLYYKSKNLSITHDTIFINIIVVHDKSGHKSINVRGAEIGGLMDWLNCKMQSLQNSTSSNDMKNIIMMGDFNTQSSHEVCYQDMTNSPNLNTRFFDPVDEAGDWSDNPEKYSKYLTQSTRKTDPGDCLASGGMNHRYDFILLTQTMIKGRQHATGNRQQEKNEIKYIDGSYKVIGQDGIHTNKAITDKPLDTSVPSNVLDALYRMSEHLPVELKLVVR